MLHCRSGLWMIAPYDAKSLPASWNAVKPVSVTRRSLWAGGSLGGTGVRLPAAVGFGEGRDVAVVVAGAGVAGAGVVAAGLAVPASLADTSGVGATEADGRADGLTAADEAIAATDAGAAEGEAAVPAH